MATFLFAYRMPENYTPGRPAAIAAWSAWFASMGASTPPTQLATSASR